MGFLQDIKVGRKLTILIFTAVFSVSVISGLGYYYLQAANESLNDMYAKKMVPMQLIMNIRGNENAMDAAVAEAVFVVDENRSKELQKNIAAEQAAISADFSKVDSLIVDEKGSDMLGKIKNIRTKYEAARSHVLALAAKRQNEEAYRDYLLTVAPLNREYAAALQELADYYQDLSLQMNRDSSAAEEHAGLVLALLAVLVLALLAVLGLAVVKGITAPLQAMVKACEDLASGDFRDKPRQILQKDEIGQLAAALYAARSNLQKAFRQVTESAEQVAASAQQLTASAEQSATAITQVAESVSNVAAGAEKQLYTVDESSVIVEAMGASLQNTIEHANRSVENSRQATDQAGAGSIAVEKAVEQMAHIEKTVNNSAAVVGKLGERSKEIGQIVDAISGIAGQTNLLALNAAIEAARAGEQGRGFAVVAEEVRKLAEQSQEAAKQIAGLIKEIQGDTEQAVLAMDQGTRDVKVGTQVVDDAGQTFTQIRQLVEDMSEQGQAIFNSIQEIEAGNQMIVSSVKDIDEISKQAVEETQTVSAATEEQSASMQEIASSSQSLAHMAQELQAAVNQFKI